MGRQAELSRLRDLLSEASQGRGRVVLVEGRSGLGKSRIVQELVEGAAGGVAFGRGTCLEGGMAPPLWPWARAVRATRAAPTVAALTAGPESADGAHDPQSALRRLSDVADAVLDLAAEQPYALVLEDMHWADSASCDLLRLLVADVVFSRLLVVATYRPDVPGPLAERLGLVRDEPGCEQVPLRPLRDDDAEHLVRAHEPGLADETVRSVRAAAAGNPLFLRWLAERAVAERAGPSDVRTASLADPFLALLTPPTRAVVEAAAVGGGPAPVDLLAAVCEVAVADAQAAADEAAATGLLSATSPVTFQHDLLRESVLGRTAPPDRRRWHARFAAVLEETAGVRQGSAAAVARHLVASGDPGLQRRAAPWATRAAAEARQAGSWSDEADLLAIARDSLVAGGAPARERALATTDLALALYRAGQLPASVAAAGEAVATAAVAGEPEVAARAATVVAGVDDADVATTLASMTATVLQLPGLGAATRARVMAADAMNRGGGLPVPDALELGERALAAARAADDPLAILEACRLLVAVPRHPDDVAARLMLSDEAAAAARRLGDPLSMLWPLLWRVDVLVALGRSPANTVAEVSALAEDCRLPLARWHAYRELAAFGAAAGRTEEAYEWSRAADVVARQIGDRSAIGIGVAFAITERMLRGEPMDVRPESEELMLAAPPGNVGALSGRAYVLAASGRTTEAKALLDQMSPVLAAELHDPRVIGALAYAMRVAALVGDDGALARARDGLARVTPPGGGMGTGTIALGGAVANILGWADEALGRYGSAVEQYREAVVVDARMEASVALALARVGLVRSLLALGTEEARQEARTQLGPARVALEGLALPSQARDLEQVARVLGASDTAGPLSPREEEVVALVADGLSNRRIADRLVLSERTVETHVRNILTKLGLGRREEVVAWALRRGQ